MADYLKLVKENGFNIQNVPKNDWTEKICIAAVENKPMAIQYIANPSEAVCKAALRKDVDVMDFINEKQIKTYDLLNFLSQLKTEEKDLQYNLDIFSNVENKEYAKKELLVKLYSKTKNPSQKFNERLVSECPSALFIIPYSKRTEEMYSSAVKQRHNLFKYVPKTMLTEDFINQGLNCDDRIKEKNIDKDSFLSIYAVSKGNEDLRKNIINKLPMAALAFIYNELSEEEVLRIFDMASRSEVRMCLISILNAGNKPNEKICNIAFSKNAYVFSEIPDCFKTAEMCNKIARTNVNLFSCIPESLLTQKMCCDAFCRDIIAIRYIPDKYKTYKMCMDALKEPNFCIPFHKTMELIPERFFDKYMYALELARGYMDFEEIPQKFRNEELLKRALASNHKLLLIKRAEIPKCMITKEIGLYVASLDKKTCLSNLLPTFLVELIKEDVTEIGPRLSENVSWDWDL